MIDRTELLLQRRAFDPLLKPFETPATLTSKLEDPSESLTFCVHFLEREVSFRIELKEQNGDQKMSLTGVKMSEDVWFTCLTHALSTETEEIMGLLLGDIEVTL